MMKRRLLLNGIGAAALLAGLPLRAQQAGKVWRIGIIDNDASWDAFRSGLSELGYGEGRSIALEYRDAKGVPEGLMKAATEFANLPVDIIVVYGTPAALAAKQATMTIPIVAIGIGDPVRVGLVESLAKPGGNITGNTMLGPELGPKRLQIIKEAIPAVSRVAFIWNRSNDSNAALLAELLLVAPKLGIKLFSVPVRNAGEMDSAFEAMMAEKPQALMTTADALLQRNIGRIVDFQMKRRLPAFFQYRGNAVAGGFMSYGPSQPELFRSGALYVHRILKGTRPADLPIELPTMFELTVNMKTARALGIKVPQSILLRADRVIE